MGGRSQNVQASFRFAPVHQSKIHEHCKRTVKHVTIFLFFLGYTRCTIYSLYSFCILDVPVCSHRFVSSWTSLKALPQHHRLSYSNFSIIFSDVKWTIFLGLIVVRNGVRLLQVKKLLLSIAGGVNLLVCNFCISGAYWNRRGVASSIDILSGFFRYSAIRLLCFIDVLSFFVGACARYLSEYFWWRTPDIQM